MPKLTTKQIVAIVAGFSGLAVVGAGAFWYYNSQSSSQTVTPSLSPVMVIYSFAQRTDAR